MRQPALAEALRQHGAVDATRLEHHDVVVIRERINPHHALLAGDASPFVAAVWTNHDDPERVDEVILA
jgi:hypothetical protein